MSYTGHVTPGGPSDLRRLDRATIRKMSVSEMHNNVYLITCNATGEQLLIDAADDPHRCQLLVREGTGRLDHLVTTHQHWDHVRALERGRPRHRRHDVCRCRRRRRAAGARPTCACSTATRHRRRARARRAPPARAHARVGGAAWADPDGHTHLFTGDSLFPGGVGNTKNPGQSFESLYADASSGSSTGHDDDTWFYPGHGDDSTIGAERPHLRRSGATAAGDARAQRRTARRAPSAAR